MKPFELEKALKGNKLITKNGLEAKITFHDKESESLLVVISEEDGLEAVWYDEFGKMQTDRDEDYDLFMNVEKQKVYIAIGKKLKLFAEVEEGCYWSSSAFKSKGELLHHLNGKISYTDDHEIVEIEVEVEV